MLKCLQNCNALSSCIVIIVPVIGERCQPREAAADVRGERRAGFVEQISAEQHRTGL